MLEKLWKKIIRRKRFSYLSLLAFILWIASLFYRIIQKLYWLPKKVEVKTKTPLISIGNITIGGTGKTPIVSFIAHFLLKENHQVGIVSSGYGRKSSKNYILPGYKIVHLDTSEVGDEVKHLAEILPNAIFSIHEIKAEAARLLDESEKVDLIIVDDGFQHRKLHRDINIVTIDASIKEKFIKLFPYGLLREPEKRLSEADLMIFTRTEFAQELPALVQKVTNYNPKAKHYFARFSATEIIGAEQSFPIKYLEDKSVLLFAGIGNFKTLKKQVTRLCADVDFALEFSDHQEYTVELLEAVKLMAEKYDSDLILTTGKDAVKIVNFDFGREFYYLNQTIDLDPGEEKLIEYIQEKFKLKKEHF